MKSLSKVLKSGQTVLEAGKVGVYQMPDKNTQKEQKSPSPSSEKSDSGTDGDRPVSYSLISEEKRRILERARNQAEQSAARILEDAYAKRDKIINTATEEARRLKAQAEEEGYEAGLVKSESDIQKGLEEIRKSVTDLDRQFEVYTAVIQNKVTELALMIAEKILQKKVEQGGTELAELVEQAVLSERDKSELVIHVSDKSMRLVEELERKLEPLKNKQGQTLRIKPEAQPPGYVQIETEEGIVDASVFVQLENLRQQLAALGKTK